MTPQEWRKIRVLLEEALELPPRERAVFLDQSQPDAATRREIEALIASAESADTILDQPLLDREFTIPSGQMIGKYRVVERVAQGGMGAVYKAWDTVLNRDAALKVIPAAFAADIADRDRLIAEARAASALNHPNIVTVYDVLEHFGSPVIAMEYIAGESLKCRLESRPVALPEALAIAAQIASGLARAGAAGIVHRDLKPGNLLIREDGLVKIVDFGLAERIAVGGEDRHNTVAGTAGYISPEQALGRPLDQRSDVFCFGIVLYELVTGRRAFPGNTLAESLAAVLRDQPEPARRVNRKVPGSLDALLRSCLEKELEKRPASMLEVERALQSTPLDRRRGQWWPVAVVAVLAATMLYFSRPEKPPSFAVKRIPMEVADRRFPQISPDGRRIVYAQSDDEEWHLFRQELDEERQSIAVDLSRVAGISGTHPAWSPDGAWIYFRSEDQGGGIFRVAGDGSRLEKIASEGYHPAISPDGRSLVYSTEGFERPEERATTRSQLRILSLATKATRNLTSPDEVKDAIQPRFSPDGERVSYWGIDTGGRRQVWTISASGRNRALAAPDGKMDWDPVWSSDGHLYFASTRGGSQNLWRTSIDPASGAPKMEAEAVVLPADYGGYFSFSRDGSRMSYLHVQPTAVVCRLNMDANPVSYTRISPLSRRVRFPSISPDGEWIAAYIQEPNEDLVVFRKDGSEFRQLTNDAHRDRDPSWMPDGRAITFGSNRGGDYQLWSINSDGAGLRQLFHNSNGAFVAVWSSESDRMAWFARGFQAHISDRGVSRALSSPGAGLGFRPMSWSDDSRLLLGSLRRGAGEVAGIAVYHVDGAFYQRLDINAIHAKWLLPGSDVVYTTGRGFFRYSLRTGKSVILLHGIHDIAPEFSIAPDGKSLYFTLQKNTAEVWVAEQKSGKR